MSRGHIRQRSPGSFEIIYRDAAGKQRSETIRTTRKGEAQALLTKRLAMVDARKHPDDPHKHSVSTFSQEWIEIIAGEVSPRRVINCESALKVHILPEFGDVRLAKLSEPHIQRFYTGLTKKGLKGSSARQIANVLTAMLRRAVELKYIPGSPAEPLSKRKPKPDGDEETTILEDGQARQLLEAARETEMFLPVLIGLHTGARRNEILGLTWRDIDLDAGEMRIERSIFQTKDRREHKAPKNGQRRTVMLGDDLVEELRRAQMKQAEHLLRLGKRQEPDTEVCHRFDGSLHTQDTLSDQFAALIKRAGLPRCSFHSMRHACASMMLRHGVPPHVAARQLGHKDGGALLLKVYAKPSESDERAAAAKIAGLFRR